MLLATLLIIAIAYWVADGDWLITCVLSVVVIVVVLLARACYDDYKRRKYREWEKKSRLLHKKKQNQIKLEEIHAKYGLNANVVNYELLKFFVADERNSILLINDKEYQFKDVLNFTISDHTKTIYTSIQSETVSENSLRRAIVGGIFAGGVGAVIGGTTGNQITTSIGESSIEHDFFIRVTVDNISNPLESVSLGTDEDSTYKIAALLNVVIARNNDKRPH